ncbi:hypothetical protein [Dietzia natronolimnaea]|uniref:hypothetical protein n=1 Tax=Dietzia natronolimnaea TaxID=161920 RepID=UPI0015FBDF5A|nr:hypothetical protein [Dietzia natronolimnaea]MBB1036938.1 hypothetical protein [Dietzia natronolimnaea]
MKGLLENTAALRELTRFVVTLALVIAVFWCIYLVGSFMGTPVTKQPDDTLLDPYQRAVGLLATLLPLLTIVVGYWFGVTGKDQAEQRANNAQHKLDAVLDSSDEPGLLEKATNRYPSVFGE